MKEKEFEALQSVLPGLEKEMPGTYKKLAEIIQCKALEVCWREEETGKREICIPYMMNDALECYLMLENGRMTGTYLPGFQEQTEAYLVKDQEVQGLVVRQEENVFTLWFDGITEHLQCYPYHEISHFWRTGMEQWRQLVYMVGTIYDKYEYLGEEVCNPKELELIPLMEFAPFRTWSPIKESLDAWYNDTYSGVEAMMQLAVEAGEPSLKKWLEQYQKRPGVRLKKKIERFLSGKKGAGIYQLLYKKVCEASSVYPARNYGTVMNKRIQQERKQVEQKLFEQGYCGAYPDFWKGSVQVHAVEEHPFTIFEAEDFVFRIQFMVSVSRKTTSLRNYGFFRGFGNRGWIERSLEDLHE